MTYSVIWDNIALKQVRKLDPKVRSRIVRKIVSLESNPRPSGSLKLENMPNVWRIRVGDYRVLYAIEDDQLLILVVKIAHRGVVYR
ncbi:MAG: type II toxin-antitoxin system RelE/ParE family toxin [Magnetococcus sp. DMHC-1]|nr:type II toxin-antitoxin system RelE/ParE family toxin [Magnetococcales bacterium]